MSVNYIFRKALIKDTPNYLAFLIEEFGSEKPVNYGLFVANARFYLRVSDKDMERFQKEVMANEVERYESNGNSSEPKNQEISRLVAHIKRESIESELSNGEIKKSIDSIFSR